MADSETIDDYELINCVVTGNATQIWEVKKAGATQSMAMKILLPEAFKDPEAKKNLKHEASVGKSLEHPNIIRIQEVKFTRHHGYYIMEYFRGGNVKAMIRNEKPQVQAKAKRIVECISQALGHMHDKKWIHKDVKPDNVLLTKGGEVRLIDFSLAGRAGNSVVHAMSKKANIVIQGTRTYLAPELIRREVLTHSVDIYSLGVMTYEMLTGNPPFRTANPNDLLMMQVRDAPAPPTMLDSNITPEAEKFVLRLLAKKPKDRPANMQEVFAEVRNINFFKVDPIEHARSTHAAFMASDAQQQNDRLDSRLDAKRTAEGGAQPAPKPKPKIVIPPEPVKPAAKAPVAAAPVPPQAQPQPPFSPYPAMAPPGMPMPGYPMPGYPMQPGMMPPGYPMQPGMPPMPFPGYPGMPGGQMPGGYPGMPMPGMPFPQRPGMPMPGQPIPVPGQPAPAMPTAAQPGMPAPAAPRPAAPAPSAPTAAPAPKSETPLASLDDLDIE
ncbi:serine/threonine protein kinase [Planctomicrobium sp. SH661]|uniref:serine/threonine protein kinase n=1 Tax=Planctomicrobium sp. SH661 TaxID=3448124 RepID=UPI003F5B686D